MAIIRRTIQNLKPGKEYILSARSVNNDLSITSAPADFIRFTVPGDQTVPGVPIGLSLNASFLSVMFVFQSVSDLDINYYEYELYLEGQITGTSPNYEVVDGQSPYRSGENPANVFVVEVAENSTTSSTGSVDNPVKYFGRVRSVDTTGNKSDWSTIVVSGDTPLVDEEFIGSLTAGKITAGTIGAHTITLDGANSIIKSSNYSPGSAGWFINGSGSAEFSDITSRGSVVAEQFILFDSDEMGGLGSNSAEFYNSSYILGKRPSIPLISVSPNSPTPPASLQDYRSSSFLSFDHAYGELGVDPSSIAWSRGYDSQNNWQVFNIVGPSSNQFSSYTGTPSHIEMFTEPDTGSNLVKIYSGGAYLGAPYEYFSPTENASEIKLQGGSKSLTRSSSSTPGVTLIARRLNDVSYMIMDPYEVSFTVGIASLPSLVIGEDKVSILPSLVAQSVNILNKTSSFTVADEDLGSLIEIDSSLTTNVYLGSPANAFEGAQISFVRKGTGLVNFYGTGIYTIISAGGRTSLTSQYSFATAIYRGNNQWYLTGDLS